MGETNPARIKLTLAHTLNTNLAVGCVLLVAASFMQPGSLYITAAACVKVRP